MLSPRWPGAPGHRLWPNELSDIRALLDATLAERPFDFAEAAVDDLKAGALSLHDVFLVHGSGPNRSKNRRAAFVIRYMPATSHFDRSEAKVGSQHVNTRLAERGIYLVRGEDWTSKTSMVDLRP